MGKRFSRRNFLKYSLATNIVIWTSEAIARKLNISLKEMQIFDIAAASAPSITTFPQSVSSGEPQTHGITLWTRIIAKSEVAKVAFEVAADSAFSQVVLQGFANTNSHCDYTVKIPLESNVLKPYTTYYYRFIFNKAVSPIGRFKTLPSPQDQTLDKIKFAYINCHDYINGYYNAYEFLAKEDIDFVVFLGDYIYETVNDTTSQREIRSLNLPSGELIASTLEDYRFLYQTYNSDPQLQRLREKFAFITIWDDHEFANDCFQANAPDQFPFYKPELRQAATQAWAEYTPISIPFSINNKNFNSLQIYRTFKFGNLLELVLTDERLYRDEPPSCDDSVTQKQRYETRKRYLVSDSPQRNDAHRTMLGHRQRDWLIKQICNSSCIWKIWGNEVMTMQLKLLSVFATLFLGQKTPDLFINLDQWDAYPAERTLLFKAIKAAKVKNFVTITGDLHTFVAGYQKLDFDDQSDQPMGVEFVVGSITASNLAERINLNSFNLPLPSIETVTTLIQLSNPHICYFNSNTHGYNIVEVTPEALICTFKVVSNIIKPGGRVSTLKVFRVPRDQVLIEDITPT
ncbi:phosphodiesterase/alkaline phosphatase D [Nostoc sp. PCC 7524]|uniref:alkaline phosphatase D family protein n=1 Tax=Nostoc sp. (strain ATCC 29411 / PCC 7524) TaxID=28072 RepID=UPI00029F231A|nr:alkaline phosphatase D family protein [Nostoc sp. PCC 7524]AFY49315.1 phosphodiesterase/alkaline phosphatase D [Nostoc sp. PCC 7524]